MTSLREPLLRLSAFINAQPLRQRMIALVMVLAALALAGDRLLFQPLLRQRTQLQQEIKTVSEELVLLDNRRSLDSDSRSGLIAADIAKMRSDINARTRELAELRQKFIPPGKTPGMVQRLVKADPRLTLLRMETLPPAPLDPLDKEERKLWQHNHRMVLAGNYFAIRDYLQALERSDWPIYWQSLRLDRDAHGVSTVTLTFSSLSEDEQWLEF